MATLYQLTSINPDHPETEAGIWHEPCGKTSMAELATKERNKLRKSQFAYVDKDGEGHLPINDESHIRNAMARWNQTDFESAAAKEAARQKILRAAKRHSIEVGEDDKIAKKSR